MKKDMKNGFAEGISRQQGKPRLVVVGAGMAAARLLEELRPGEGLARWDVTWIGEEPSEPYNRVLLSSLLQGKQKKEEMLLQPADWGLRHGIHSLFGHRVERIDREKRLVFTEDRTVPYDRLVLATGSRPLLPPISGLQGRDGALRPGVFAFRTMEDCERILAASRSARRAVVIGGGLLGLEAAYGLLAHELEVHVVHLAGHLMEQQLDPGAGAVLRDLLQRQGISIHLHANTQAILGTGEKPEAVRLSDGATLDADLIVLAAGIRPNGELAKGCGLPVGRGILVDDQLRSPADPAVHAIGECAEHEGRVYGLVAPAWEQARVLADLLADRNPHSRYRGSRIATQLKVSGIDLTVFGENEPRHPDDEVFQYAEPKAGVYKKLLLRGGRLVGAILLGESAKGAELLSFFEQETPIPSPQALLFGSAQGVSPAPAPSDDQRICFCHSVSKRQLRQAVEGGCSTLRELCEQTRAATGCGSCKPEVKRLLLEFRGAPPQEDPKAHYYVPGVPLQKPELVAEIRRRNLRSVSAVFRELAQGREDAASKPGIASLLKSLWKDRYEDERDARHINDRVHANVQKDGTFSVVPRIYGGVVSSAELRRIADVADNYRVPMIKITGGQRIDLLGLKKEQLPAVWRDLGMPSGHAYTKAFRTCKTCVGTDFCRFGLGDSTRLGIDLEKSFQGLETPAKVKMAVSGCPRNCAEATTKDLGVVAIESGWQIYVGGAAGSRVRAGDLLATVPEPEEVIRMAGRFLAHYQENAKYGERSYGFVERFGIERLRSVLLEDAEGRAEELDREIEASIRAYRDPWLEGNHAIEPGQFREVKEITLSEERR